MSRGVDIVALVLVNGGSLVLYVLVQAIVERSFVGESRLIDGNVPLLGIDVVLFELPWPGLGVSDLSRHTVPRVGPRKPLDSCLTRGTYYRWRTRPGMSSSGELPPEQVRAWIDDLVEEIERVPDEAAVFNFTVRMSGIFLHVVQRQHGGPLIIGQQLEFSKEIRTRIAEMAEDNRDTLVARLREALMEVPVVYGFQNEQGANVAFRDVERVLVEARVYSDGASQQALMDRLVAVWKALRYLDDVWGLLEYAER